MSTCWSEIPTDLVYSILSKLSIPDLFHCAAVCSDWSAEVGKLRRCPGDHRPQIPWLVPEKQFLMNGQYNHQKKYNFFSLSEGRVYDIPSPATRTLKAVVGSSYGWLITVGKVSVQLLNPITGVHINLPSIPTMGGRNLEPFKGVLSSDPSRGGDYCAVFVCYSHSHDIAFHKGKLYAVSLSEENGQLTIAVCDLLTPDSTPTLTPVVVLSDAATWDFDVVLYFFCTSSDDLLMARVMTKRLELDDAHRLEVWNVDTEKGAIIAMNNLGKRALFLSPGSSLCIDTSSLPDLKSNSVYISVDLYDTGSSDNLVYSMEDGSFAALSLPSLSSRARRRRRPFSFRRPILVLKLLRPILVWFAPSIACRSNDILRDSCATTPTDRHCHRRRHTVPPSPATASGPMEAQLAGAPSGTGFRPESGEFCQNLADNDGQPILAESQPILPRLIFDRNLAGNRPQFD